MRRSAVVAAGLAAVFAAAAAAALAARHAGTATIVVLGRESAPPTGTLVWSGTDTALGGPMLLREAEGSVVSADGRTLAYAVRAGGGLEIRVRVRGRVRTVAWVAAPATSLALFPDGTRLVFASRVGLETVHLTGRPARGAVSLPRSWRGSTYAALAVSPDGDTIAFSRTWGDGRAGTLRNELGAVQVDGSGARRLYRNADPYSARPEPVFSPDGTNVAFTIGDRAVATVSASGGRVTVVTRPPVRSADMRPIWSPDGIWLAFARRPTFGASDVYLVRPDGTGLRRVTTTPIPPRGEPRTGSVPLAWSPRGFRLLAFRHDRIVLVDVQTRAQTPLTLGGIAAPPHSVSYSGGKA